MRSKRLKVLRTVATPDPIYLKQPAAARYIGVSVPWFRGRAVSDPTFPKPIRIGPRITLYAIDALRAWVAAQGAAK